MNAEICLSYKNPQYCLLICQLLRNEFGDHNDKHGKLKINMDLCNVMCNV